MAINVVERVEALQSEEEALLRMHFAATRVLDSTRGGGWGTFRIDGVNEEEIKRLPSYIQEFAGQRLPVLFYETTSSAETDTLQIINSIVKSAFFIWLLIKFLPQWFGIEKKKTIRRNSIRRVLPA